MSRSVHRGRRQPVPIALQKLYEKLHSLAEGQSGLIQELSHADEIEVSEKLRVANAHFIEARQMDRLGRKGNSDAMGLNRALCKKGAIVYGRMMEATSDSNIDLANESHFATPNGNFVSKTYPYVIIGQGKYGARALQLSSFNGKGLSAEQIESNPGLLRGSLRAVAKVDSYGLFEGETAPAIFNHRGGLKSSSRLIFKEVLLQYDDVLGEDETGNSLTAEGARNLIPFILRNSIASVNELGEAYGFKVEGSWQVMEMDTVIRSPRMSAIEYDKFQHLEYDIKTYGRSLTQYAESVEGDTEPDPGNNVTRAEPLASSSSVEEPGCAATSSALASSFGNKPAQHKQNKSDAALTRAQLRAAAITNPDLGLPAGFQRHGLASNKKSPPTLTDVKDDLMATKLLGTGTITAMAIAAASAKESATAGNRGRKRRFEGSDRGGNNKKNSRVGRPVKTKAELDQEMDDHQAALAVQSK